MGYGNNSNEIIQIDNKQLEDEVSANTNKIGLLSNLKTTDKSSLVNAVNENTSRLADIAINVKSFGAKGNANYYNSTDGNWYEDNAFTILASDDKAAIQAAIDSIDKGTIFFPEGNYLLTGNYPIDGGQNDTNARLTPALKIKSNLTFTGNNATLHAASNCSFIFDTAIRQAVTTDDQALKNITIRNLKFEKDMIAFNNNRAFWHLIQIESCINLLIENCKFEGWSGDAICIGTLAYPDLSDWYQTVVRNVRILNCDFDGVNKNNRQAISIVCGEDVLIDNCHFKRTTYSGMPGAIDIEPDRAYEYANNIHISNCTFDDIGGIGDSVAAVSFILQTSLNSQASDFSVKNCSFNNCFRAYKVIGLQSDIEDSLASGSPKNFEFSGNAIKECQYWFTFGGVENLTVKNENVQHITQKSYIGSLDYSPKFLPLASFYFIANVINDYLITADSNAQPFNIDGNLLGGSISNNKFFDCGNYSNSFGGYELFRVFYTNFTKHKNLYYGDNVFIDTGKYSFQHTPTQIFFVNSDLVNGDKIIVKDNQIVNITENKSDYNLYKYAKVLGYFGVVSNSNIYNTPSSYLETTLPDDLPLGITASGNSSYTLITFKPNPNGSYRYYTLQYKYDYNTQTLQFRRPDTSTNTWIVWKTITAS